MAALAKAKDARTCGMAVVHVGLRCTPLGTDTPPSAREEGEGRCTHTHVDGRPHPGSEEQRDVVVEDVDDVGEKVDVDDVDDDVDDVDDDVDDVDDDVDDVGEKVDVDDVDDDSVDGVGGEEEVDPRCHEERARKKSTRRGVGEAVQPRPRGRWKGRGSVARRGPTTAPVRRTRETWNATHACGAIRHVL